MTATMIKKYRLSTLAIALLSSLIASCSSSLQPINSSEASLGYVTQITQALRNLPAPKEKMVVTVYKFKDQTGQYKDESPSMTYSSAVTQGATAMLIKALTEAGNGTWFTVLERESISNLLNERKIIQQTRQQYADSAKNNAAAAKNNAAAAKNTDLTPLLYSPLIYEGGVIAYQSNSITGGIGARYLGIGGSTDFQRDFVSIYLRLVSVKNGNILQSIDTAKTIFSFKVDAGAFKFVALKDLLEVEAGFTSNEPSQMAVLEAIEKAVYASVLEGAMSGLWQFKDPNQAAFLLTEYKKEKNNDYMPNLPITTDVMSRQLTK